MTVEPQSWAKSAGMLTVATVAVSGGNYAFSLAAVHLLGPEAFSTFAAAQGLLLVLGTGCMAAVPWAVARYMAVEQHPGAGQEAMHFGLVASTWQAVVAGPLAGMVMWLAVGPAVGLITAVGAFFIALSAAPTGFLQGNGEVGRIAALRLIEVIGRLAGGLALVLLVSPSATNALLGFPIGTGLLFGLGMLWSATGFPLKRPKRSAGRHLLRQSFQLGLVQILLAMLASLDAVVAQMSRFDSVVAGSYQAAGLLGRVPLFLSGAIALASYTAMARSHDDAEVGKHLHRGLGMYLAVTLPIVVSCWTIPQALLEIVIPGQYANAATLLRYTILSGAALGLINVIATAHQARARFAPIVRILLPAALIQPILLILAGRSMGVTAFAGALVITSLFTATVVCTDARRWHPFAIPSHPGQWLVILTALLGSCLVSDPFLWMLYMLGVTLSIISTASGAFEKLARRRRSPQIAPTISIVDKPGSENANDAPPFAPQSASSTVEPTRRKPQLGADPDGPRVVLIGDSYIYGLGYSGGPAFGRLAADKFGFSAILNLSASARTAADTLEFYTDQLIEFRPHLALVNLGGTEGMVLPNHRVQTLIDRVAPSSWHGVAGLEPRARFSDDRALRRRQKIEASLKVPIKWILIRAAGGRPRIPLDLVLNHSTQLLDLLDSIGASTWVVELPHAPRARFPGTERSFRNTNRAIAQLIATRPSATFVSVESLHYYQDFLGDHIHLNGTGHQRVAALLVDAVRRNDAYARRFSAKA